MISFGNKIEFATCRVLDRQNNTFKPAEMYEFDCNNVSDICYIKFKNPRTWDFKNYIYNDMIRKYRLKKVNKLVKLDYLRNSRYFALEDDDKNLICACETGKNKNNIEIRYISSIEKEKYKYSAKALLVALAKQNLKENKGTIVIPTPTPKAQSYYTKTCGFSKKDDEYITLIHKDPEKFVEENEKRFKINLLV